MNFLSLSAFLAKSGGEVHQKCERTLPDAYLGLYQSFGGKQSLTYLIHFEQPSILPIAQLFLLSTVELQRGLNRSSSSFIENGSRLARSPC